MPQKPWRQLAFAIGEAGLSLISGGVLFIIISRTAGPGLLGAYALGLAWLTLFQGVSSFGIPEFVLREAGAHGPRAATQVVHAMLLGLGSGFLAMCLMLLTVRGLGYQAYLVDVISVASLALFPAFLNTACRAVFVAQRQMHVPFFAALIEMAIMTSASLYLVLSGYGAVALMVALVVAKVASATLEIILLFRRVFSVRPPFHLDILVKTARTVFVFGMGNVIGMLSKRINVIFLSLWVSIDMVGHFAAATKVMEFGLIAPEMFAQLLLTRIAHSFNATDNRDPNRFRAWYEILFSLVLPISVGGCVFAEFILVTLFGKPFDDAVWILRILMIYMLTETADVVMSAILKAAHRQRADVLCLSASLTANVALNFALLPFLGPIGPAIARVGGGIASTTPRYLLIARILKRLDWLSIAAKPALISMGVGLACYAALAVARPTWVLAAYVVLTAIGLKLSSSFSFATIKDIMSFPTGAEAPAPNPTTALDAPL